MMTDFDKNLSPFGVVLVQWLLLPGTLFAITIALILLIIFGAQYVIMNKKYRLNFNEFFDFRFKFLDPIHRINKRKIKHAFFTDGSDKWVVSEYVKNKKESEWFIRLTLYRNPNYEIIVGFNDIRKKKFTINKYESSVELKSGLTVGEREMCLGIVNMMIKSSSKIKEVSVYDSLQGR
jgi:hypothetical protein